jgi:hypothetical protein
MRSKRERGYISGLLKYAPEIILVVYFAYISNYIIDITFGDDVDYYIHILGGMTLRDYLFERYTGWSSRLLVDILTIYMVRIQKIWKILNVLVTLAIYENIIGIIKDAGKEDVRVDRFVVLAIMVLYPYQMDMNTAGWVATTLNYWWVLAALIFSIRCMLVWYRGGKLTLIHAILFPFCFLYGINQEQGALLFEMIAVSLVVYGIIDNRGKAGRCFDKRIIFCIIICFAVMVFEFTCPGNQVRKNSNIEYWLPEFAGFGIQEKIYMGSIAIYRMFVCGWNSVYKLIFTLTLLVACTGYVFDKTEIKWKTLALRVICVASVVIQIIFVYRYLKGLNDENSLFGKIFFNPGATTVVKWNEKRTFIPIVILLIYSMVVCIASICERTGREVILGCAMYGIISIMLMGFTPSVWASSERTGLFSYFLFSAIIIVLLGRLEKIRNQ